VITTIAFTSFGGEIWTGGSQYLVNLLTVLNSLDKDQRPKTVLVLENEKEIGSRLQKLVDDVLISPINLHSGFISRQLARGKLAQLLSKSGVDYIFSGVHYGALFPIPLLGWIPDFQHKRLPDMFSTEEIISRDVGYMNIVKFARKVVLSSESAKRDYAEYYPSAVKKVAVAPFMVAPPENMWADNPVKICKEYDLPEKFFYLPNQFWQHKNHEVVIEALQIVRQKRNDIVVVCTGNTYDYRKPEYFGKLLSMIARRGLRDNIILLGFVPHTTVLALIRQSTAVIQPSLFEGWSSTIEEVKSIGKTVILSDIEVHREQSPPSANYFDPQNPEGLAQLMLEQYDVLPSGPTLDLEYEARKNLRFRMTVHAQKFLDMLV